MGTMTDRIFGFGLLVFSFSLFVYYTFWVIITPFIEKDHFIHNYFPDRYYALAIPLVAFIVLLTIVLGFIALVMIKNQKRKTS